MFVLRVITGENIEINEEIGKTYSIYWADRTPEKFKEACIVVFGEANHPNEKECYAIILNGSYNRPLYKKQKNYIMTESGETFANITF